MISTLASPAEAIPTSPVSKMRCRKVWLTVMLRTSRCSTSSMRFERMPVRSTVDVSSSVSLMHLHLIHQTSIAGQKIGMRPMMK